MKNLFFLLGFTLACTSVLKGQQKKEVITPIHGLLTKYVKSINTIDQEQTTEKVLQLFSDRYTGHTTYVKLSGGIVKKSYTKADIKRQLSELINDDQYTFQLDINKILFDSQKEKGGAISALLDFKSTIENELAEQGTILINMVAVAHKDGWKIIQNNMVRVSEKKDIGDCVCYIYNKGTTKYISELYYPAGVDYAHVFETFHFVSNGNSKTIKTLNGSFSWENATGMVSKGEKELGIAKDQRSVMELLIKNLKTEACANLIFK